MRSSVISIVLILGFIVILVQCRPSKESKESNESSEEKSDKSTQKHNHDHDHSHDHHHGHDHPHPHPKVRKPQLPQGARVPGAPTPIDGLTKGDNSDVIPNQPQFVSLPEQKNQQEGIQVVEIPLGVDQNPQLDTETTTTDIVDNSGTIPNEQINYSTTGSPNELEDNQTVQPQLKSIGASASLACANGQPGQDNICRERVNL